MKRTLFAFTVIAGVAATLLSGCGKDPEPTVPKDYFSGTHTIYINGINLQTLIEPIPDTLDISVDTTSISLYSRLIKRTLTGTIDTLSGNVTMDSLIFVTGDTLRISSSVAPGGVAKIWDVRAGGSGKLVNNTATTELKVAQGKTNFGAIGTFDLSNLEGKNLALKGTFNK